MCSSWVVRSIFRLAGRCSSNARRLEGSAGVGGVIDSLKTEARDLGTPGRDSIYGWGELAIPQALTANSR